MAKPLTSSIMATRSSAVFCSIFPAREHTIPTPKATPLIGVLGSPGATFGGFNAQHGQPLDAAADFARAWSTATRFLSLPSGLHGIEDRADSSRESQTALTYLLSDSSTCNELSNWYEREMRNHWQRYVLPELHSWKDSIPLDESSVVLSHTIHTVESAQKIYTRFSSSKSSPRAPFFDSFMSKLRHAIHALVLHSLPYPRVEQALAYHIFNNMAVGLLAKSDPTRCIREDNCSCMPRVDLDILAKLEAVGLGGVLGERAFALAINEFLLGPAIERRCFAVDWIGHTSVVPRLRTWMRDRLQPCLGRAISTLAGANSFDLAGDYDLGQLSSIAVANLGRLRVASLYEYVKAWPESQGALQDIKEYLVSGGLAAKALMCSEFSEQIRVRLLHAGASTTEILGIYVSVIHAMKVLDPRGVLLEKIAVPIRNYLRNRDDTASIIARSFLARLDDSGEVIADNDEDASMICVDITRELVSCSLDVKDTKSLNWSDMDWVPDPIDAGPEYKSSRSDDVVADIFGLFDHDDLIKAVTVAFGDHLRHTSDTELINETKLVELLKSRLDVSKLQAIEVMLKDVRESVLLNRRANPRQHRQAFLDEPSPKDIQAAIPDEGITLQELYSIFKARLSLTKFTNHVRMVAQKRNDLYFAKRTILSDDNQPETALTDESEVLFDAKVLSGYFWPQELEPSESKVNIMGVESRKRTYAEAFATISGQRKLEWAPDLDTMDIELELEDRTIEIKGVLAWRWAVLSAFTGGDVDSDGGTSDENVDGLELTASDVAERLAMEEDIVLSAFAYWISKDVLYQKAPGVYAILERRDLDIDHDASGDAEESLLQINLDDVQFRRAMPMIEVFIKNMLNAGGGRSVAGPTGITMMLQMMMPGFAYGDSEVMRVLDEMKSKGEAAVEGELWRVI